MFKKKRIAFGFHALYSFTLHVTWSLKEERESSSRYNPRTASTLRQILESICTVQIYWDEYCTSPVFLWCACLDISTKNLVVASLRNRNASVTNKGKFFPYWNDVFFEFNVCSYTNVFYVVSYLSNFFVSGPNILMWLLKKNTPS